MKVKIKTNGLENMSDIDKVGVACACHHRKGWRAIKHQINKLACSTQYSGGLTTIIHW